MKLYWSPRSPFVRKVMVCAHELGIAHDIEKIYSLVSMSATNPAVLQANPLGRIPALVTDEAVRARDAAMRAGADAFAPLFPPPRERWVRDLALGADTLAAVVAPVLLVHGAHDRLTPFEFAAQLVAVARSLIQNGEQTLTNRHGAPG